MGLQGEEAMPRHSQLERKGGVSERTYNPIRWVSERISIKLYLIITHNGGWVQSHGIIRSNTTHTHTEGEARATEIECSQYRVVVVVVVVTSSTRREKG